MSVMSGAIGAPAPDAEPSPLAAGDGKVELCAAGTCLTCADEAVPVRVIRLLDHDLAMVDAGAGPEEVSVALVPARVGDTVLVHAKEAIAVVTDDG